MVGRKLVGIPYLTEISSFFLYWRNKKKVQPIRIHVHINIETAVKLTTSSTYSRYHIVIEYKIVFLKQYLIFDSVYIVLKYVCYRIIHSLYSNIRFVILR